MPNIITMSSEISYFIPISQVMVNIMANYTCRTIQAALPGLHVSMGISIKLWRLLETAAHELDLELAMRDGGRAEDRQAFAEYSEKKHDIQKLEEEKEAVVQYATTVDGLTTAVAMRVGQTNHMVQSLRQEAVKARDLLTKIVSNVYTHVKKLFHLSEC